MSNAAAANERRATSWGAGLLFTAVILAYANTLHAPFVYDDTKAILENPSIRQLWSMRDVLGPQSEGGLTVSGRPVLNLSLALSYALSGERPWGHHLFNGLVHAAATLLLFGIIRRTTHPQSAPSPSGSFARAAKHAGASGLHPALAVAALWALHPLQTQAVTYTVQRAESLMGLLCLLTLYAFVRATGASARRWFAVSVGACVLGMGTKEVMATAPLVVLLYDRTFVAGTFAGAWRARRGYYLALAATWLVLGALIATTGLNRGGTVGVGVDVPWWAYGLTQFQAITRYLALTVWPSPLTFEYGTLWVREAAEVLPHAAIVLPLLAATIVALRRWPAAGFCGASFFLILAPTSLAPGTLQMIVEHRMYLPLAAVLALTVIPAWRCMPKIAPGAATAVALAAGWLTFDRNHDYRSNLSLWADTVAKRPENPRAREGLAEALEAIGRTEEALAQRRESIRLAPDNGHAHFNLALTLAQAGQFEPAITHYHTALRLLPDEARTHNNLAVTLAQLGRTEEAFVHYGHAQRLAPREPEFLYNHGLALARVGRTSDALTQFETARRLRPRHPTTNLTLGEAFAAAGRYAEAAECYRAALVREPDNARAHLLLGDALLELDRAPEAAASYETAARLRPAHAETQHNLGVAYAQLGRWADAQRQFETALSLKPEYPEARRNLDRLRQVLGK